MSDEADEVVPDEPLDTLVDEVDHEVREETRATSRENLRVYLKEIGRIRLLTREQEGELARRVRAGDAAAKAQLTEANLRLVVQIARRYLNRGLPLPDPTRAKSRARSPAPKARRFCLAAQASGQPTRQE